jgi:hypothetical protein
MFSAGAAGSCADGGWRPSPGGLNKPLLVISERNESQPGQNSFTTQLLPPPTISTLLLAVLASCPRRLRTACFQRARKVSCRVPDAPAPTRLTLPQPCRPPRMAQVQKRNMLQVASPAPRWLAARFETSASTSCCAPSSLPTAVRKTVNTHRRLPSFYTKRRLCYPSALVRARTGCTRRASIGHPLTCRRQGRASCKRAETMFHADIRWSLAQHFPLANSVQHYSSLHYSLANPAHHGLPPIRYQHCRLTSYSTLTTLLLADHIVQPRLPPCYSRRTTLRH